MQSDSSHLISIKSKLAFFLALIGFCMITLLPISGLTPGVLMSSYSFYLAIQVSNVKPNDQLANSSAFLSFCSGCFLLAIGLMYISINYL